MASGAPDWFATPQTVYDTYEETLTPGQNPEVTPSIKVLDTTIFAEMDIVVKLNSTSNAAISVKAIRPYMVRAFPVTKVFITNTETGFVQLLFTGVPST